MSGSEKLSYLVPRDPSIKSWSDRVKLPASFTQNTLSFGTENFEENQDDKLKVYLRIKPCNTNVTSYTVVGNTLEAEAPKGIIGNKKPSNNIRKLIQKFHFTSVFNQGSSQDSVFEECALTNLKRFIKGSNNLLFAYGTTSAGKTFTIQGTVDRPGLIPRVIQFLFYNLKDNLDTLCKYQPRRYNDLCLVSDEDLKKQLIHKNFILNTDLTKSLYQETHYRGQRTETSSLSNVSADVYENMKFQQIENSLIYLDPDLRNSQYSIWISMVEIYNEQIYDLLEIPCEKDGRGKLGFAEDENGKVYIKNLRYVNAASGHEAYKIFQFGKANLHFGCTALNDQSSRSHCIFTITLARFLDPDKSAEAILSRFSFCDLAGFERVKKTLTVGQRLEECKSINTSLSTFAKCLTILKENQVMGEKKIVPYRESKLTRLFRDAMMGKESLSIIVNITPDAHFFNETLHVLKFSAIAQQIVPVNNLVQIKRLRSDRRSRFATVVSHTTGESKIDWETGTIIKLKKEDKNAQVCGELLKLIDILKNELAEERKRAENIENNVREELAVQFSEIILEHNEKNRNILECETQRMQEMFDRKEKRLIEYFKKEKENLKRKRVEEIYSDGIKADSQTERLMTEMDYLKTENTSLRELIQQMKSDNNKLQVRCTQLEFELSEKERIIKLNEKTYEDDDDHVKKLLSQLQESKTKIEELKKLLDESAFDYKDLLETNKNLSEENEFLSHELAKTSNAVEDLKRDLREYKVMLSMKALPKEESKKKVNDEKVKIKPEVQPCKVNLELEEVRKCSNINAKYEMNMIGELEKSSYGQDLSVVATKTQLENKSCIAGSEKISEIKKPLVLKTDQEKYDLVKNKSYSHSVIEENSAGNIGKTNGNDEGLIEQCRQYRSECDLKNDENPLDKEPLSNSFYLSEYRASEINDDLYINENLEKEKYGFIKPQRNSDDKDCEETDEPRIDKNNGKEYSRSFPLEEETELYSNHNSPIVQETETVKEHEFIVLLQKDDEKKFKISDNIKNIQVNSLEVSKHNVENNVSGNDNVNEKSYTEEAVSKHNVENNVRSNDNINEKSYTGHGDASNNEKNYVNNFDKNRKTYELNTPERLSEKFEELTIQNVDMKKTSKKILEDLEENIHPSLIKIRGKNRRKGKKCYGKENCDKKEKEMDNEPEEIPALKKQNKCTRKLFIENDFDDIGDLDTSFVEPEVPRLRPRKK